MLCYPNDVLLKIGLGTTLSISFPSYSTDLLIDYLMVTISLLDPLSY